MHEFLQHCWTLGQGAQATRDTVRMHELRVVHDERSPARICQCRGAFAKGRMSTGFYQAQAFFQPVGTQAMKLVVRDFLAEFRIFLFEMVLIDHWHIAAGVVQVPLTCERRDCRVLCQGRLAGVSRLLCAHVIRFSSGSPILSNVPLSKNAGMMMVLAFFTATNQPEEEDFIAHGPGSVVYLLRVTPLVVLVQVLVGVISNVLCCTGALATRSIGLIPLGDT